MENTIKSVYTFYEKMIIENINLEDYGINNDVYLYDKIKTLYNIFKSEYGYMTKRVGELKAFEEWLMGLPSVLTVPFTYFDILNIATVHDIIKADATEDEEDKFLKDYYNKLAIAFFTLKEKL